MPYTVKEIFYTLQGEGAQSGRPAVFCRFAGCNLWSGREEDRQTAICRFCDTDFVGTDGPGGGRFASAIELARAVAAKWPVALIAAPHSRNPRHDDSYIRSNLQSAIRNPQSAPHPHARPFVVCTGGEPLLQLDNDLTVALHHYGFEIAIETNGTKLPPAGVDWVCVSPKADAELVLCTGDELKLVFPQEGAEPERFEHLDFRHFFLQPMDGPERERNTQLAVRYCLAHPRWRLSVQTHKFLGIP